MTTAAPNMVRPIATRAAGFFRLFLSFVREYAFIMASTAVRLSVLGLAVSVFSGDLHAETYMFIDDEGVVHFTNSPTVEVLANNPGRIKAEPVSYSLPGGHEILPEPAEQGPEATRIYTDRIVHQAASSYKVDPLLIQAVIKVESDYDPFAVSSKGARGLMQLMPQTADDMSVGNTFDIRQNVNGGVRYLRHLLDRFEGNLPLALAAYNAGPSAVERHGGPPPYPETRRYVDKVLYYYGRGLNGCGPRNPNGYTGEAGSGDAERIYRIIKEDGSILFTNSPVSSNGERQERENTATDVYKGRTAEEDPGS